MLIADLILAGIAVLALARAPGSCGSALVLAAVGAAAAALGAPVTPALAVTAPLVTFVAAALTLARLAERSGLAERTAAALAKHARGSTLALYILVCGLSAALTAAVSLDGAVVLMVPLILVLARRWSVPLAPLFLGAVAVANAASIAVPQGNPTNLVVIERLGVPASAFLAHMFVPGIAAAALSAAIVAVGERRALMSRYEPSAAARTPLTPAERFAALAVAGAAASACAAPVLGVAPWWGFTGAVAVALAARRRRPELVVPWRLGVQLAGLLLVMDGLKLPATAHVSGALPALLGVAGAVGVASAVANNLPVSAWVTTILAGPAAYAGAAGLAIGSLATPHGSVATLIANELAGPAAPEFPRRRFAALAAATLLTTTLLVWALA
jgi:arsenical pump membrane protein